MPAFFGKYYVLGANNKSIDNEVMIQLLMSLIFLNSLIHPKTCYIRGFRQVTSKYKI
jgi:hypothetical protein